MGRHAELWGGPMDGASVFMGDGELPARVGMHRTADGQLVPIRTRALVQLQHSPEHVQVYERATVDVLRAFRVLMGGSRGAVGPLNTLQGVPLYVHRELVIRWQTRGQV
jgi:hypothetical protein